MVEGLVAFTSNVQLMHRLYTMLSQKLIFDSHYLNTDFPDLCPDYVHGMCHL